MKERSFARLLARRAYCPKCHGKKALRAARFDGTRGFACQSCGGQVEYPQASSSRTLREIKKRVRAYLWLEIPFLTSVTIAVIYVGVIIAFHHIPQIKRMSNNELAVLFGVLFLAPMILGWCSRYLLVKWLRVPKR